MLFLSRRSLSTPRRNVDKSERVLAFDRDRLRLGREAKGWTKQRLAEVSGVTPAAVSQYENGTARPGSAVLARMALGLGLPQGFFISGRPTVLADSSSAHFRSLRSTSLRDRRRALSHASIAWELANALERYVQMPAPSFPHAVLPERPSQDDFENLAGECRTILGIGGGPLPNVTRLLESCGAIVVRLPVGCGKVDAFSTTLSGRPIVLINDDKVDKARSRHTAAHEFGHLVAHDDVDPGSQTVERQADSFASAFLLPAEEIAPLLPSKLDWNRLIELRLHWGVSIASLLFKAKSLGILPEHTYRRAFTVLNSRKNPDGTLWRTNEPGQLGPPEQPVLLKKCVEVAAAQNVTRESLANELQLPVDVVNALIGDETRPVIRLDAVADDEH